MTNLASAIANATSGSTIYLSGSYVMAGPVSTSKSLTLQACPGGATVTGTDGKRQDWLYFTGGPVVVRGITFRANAGRFDDSTGSALLECDRCHDMLVEDVTFVGYPRMADRQQLFYQRLGTRVTVRRSTFTANGMDGFGVHQYPGSTTDPVMVVEDCYFSGFGTLGAGVTTDSRITVRRSSFKDDYRGIQLRNYATGSTLSDNHDLGGVTIRVENPSKATTNTWN